MSPPRGNEAGAPFILEIRQQDPQASGDFTPGAALLVSPGLRASGLLRVLSGEETATLLAALACLTPQGRFAVSPELVAPALGIAQWRALRRLRRLCAKSWQGAPLLSEAATTTARHRFVLSPCLVQERSVAVASDARALRESVQPPSAVQGVGVARAIEANRTRYAKPRAQVEADIGRFYGPSPLQSTNSESMNSQNEAAYDRLGIDQPSLDASHARLRQRLRDAGLSPAQSLRLLQEYPRERIERQLDWLPLRDARKPSAFLLAAVAGDYGAPHK